MAALSVWLAGCQTLLSQGNRPLAPATAGELQPRPRYDLIDMLGDADSEVFVLLAFSGGGKRSAAFAHGALRGLARIPVRNAGSTHSLLDEVDYIAAVSGGSFPALHYGLYGRKSFETFAKEFLKRDIEAFIFGTFLLPWNWEWLINPLVGTNDRMARVYDELMFHGATYADLLKRRLPVVSVNATDIAGGNAFSFTQPSFDLICSDLASFPVAQAVAASNGFPVLFSPMTLTSYNEGCTRPTSLAPVTRTGDDGPFSRRAAEARNAERLHDPNCTRFVHLMDGGIADNLALRVMLNALITLDDGSPAIRRIAPRVRRILIISIDGQSAANPALGRQRVVTGLRQLLSAVSGTQIDAFNFETLLLADQQVRALVEHVRALRCATADVLRGSACDDVQGAVVHLSLADLPDATERMRLQAIRTGLTISDADVDSLVAAGERQIVGNTTIRDMLRGLDQR